MKGILEEVEVFKYLRGKCDKQNEEKLQEIMNAYWGIGKEEVKEPWNPIQKVPSSGSDNKAWQKEQIYEENLPRLAVKQDWPHEVDKEQINKKCQNIIDNVSESLIDLNYDVN